MADRGDAAGALAVRSDDWPAHATDTVVRVVGTVRDKTTGPAVTVARAIVYGLLGAILGLAALVLVTALLVRALDAYLPEAVFGESHTWAAHLVLGLMFSLAGLVLWRLRRPRAED